MAAFRQIFLCRFTVSAMTPSAQDLPLSAVCIQITVTKISDSPLLQLPQLSQILPLITLVSKIFACTYILQIAISGI